MLHLHAAALLLLYVWFSLRLLQTKVVKEFHSSWYLNIVVCIFLVTNESLFRGEIVMPWPQTLGPQTH